MPAATLVRRQRRDRASTWGMAGPKACGAPLRCYCVAVQQIQGHPTGPGARSPRLSICPDCGNQAGGSRRLGERAVPAVFRYIPARKRRLTPAGEPTCPETEDFRQVVLHDRQSAHRGRKMNSVEGVVCASVSLGKDADGQVPTGPRVAIWQQPVNHWPPILYYSGTTGARRGDGARDVGNEADETPVYPALRILGGSGSDLRAGGAAEHGFGGRSRRGGEPVRDRDAGCTDRR